MLVMEHYHIASLILDLAERDLNPDYLIKILSAEKLAYVAKVFQHCTDIF